MRSKPQKSINNFKLLLIVTSSLVLILMIIRSTFSYSHKNNSSLSSSSSIHPLNASSNQQEKLACNKIPPSLSHALLHYATLNITPQQTLQEISVSLKVLLTKSPCNFLVFGLGHDSLLWASLNHGGRTLFLEEDQSWINQINTQLPSLLESYHVVYHTKLTQADQLLQIGKGDDCRAVGDPRFSKCPLAVKGFPNQVYDTEWDVIMVDAPTGYHDEAPGRMGVIYTAGLMARNTRKGQTHVFVHDVDRKVEDSFSKEFLCQGYLIEQQGRIRHFTIPSHRGGSSLGRSPFCPLN